MSQADASRLRAEIGRLAADYHAAAFPEKPFIPGQSPVPVSGKVFDGTDLRNLIDSSLDFWLTEGRFAAEFEKKLAAFTGIPNVTLANSGSSANLLAVSALTSPKLGDRRLKEGDEVITLAAGFPTTVNPILQNHLVPVFVDIDPATHNLDVSLLERALSPKTRAIIAAHTLGNPFDAVRVQAFAKKHSLWMIEDCCDALGSKLDGKLVGHFGDLATLSFYPAHQITTGEGGAVLTRDAKLKSILDSFRDWGRDCWCATGQDNTCGKRFDWQLGELPKGYDHKYTYSHIGYNLKMTDMQAAVGSAQIDKLPGFVEKRKNNFKMLFEGLKDLDKYFVLPKATPGSEPCWFGFPMAVKKEAPFDRNHVVRHLEGRRIATRLLFGGNLTKQPAYKSAPMRISGALTHTDFAMERAFWVGVYPGLTQPMLESVIAAFHELR